MTLYCCGSCGCKDEDLCIHPRLYSMERRTDICDKHAWRYYIRITSIYGNHIKLSIVQENTGYMKPTTACPVVSIEAKTMRAFTSKATRGVHTVMLTPAVVTLALINICIIIYYNYTCNHTQTHAHGHTHHCMFADLNLDCNHGYSHICMMFRKLHYMNVGRKHLHKHLSYTGWYIWITRCKINRKELVNVVIH